MDKEATYWKTVRISLIHPIIKVKYALGKHRSLNVFLNGLEQRSPQAQRAYTPPSLLMRHAYSRNNEIALMRMPSRTYTKLPSHLFAKVNPPSVSASVYRASNRG